MYRTAIMMMISGVISATVLSPLCSACLLGLSPALLVCGLPIWPEHWIPLPVRCGGGGGINETDDCGSCAKWETKLWSFGSVTYFQQTSTV